MLVLVRKIVSVLVGVDRCSTGFKNIPEMTEMSQIRDVREGI